MRLSICSILSALCVATVGTASAAPEPVSSTVVHLAPDFSISGAGGKPRTLRSLHGQSVVLLIAKSARTGAFKKQVKYLQELFEQFASKETVFAVALRQGDTSKLRTNVPIAVVYDGAAVADAYGVKKNFAIAIIGYDGNIDYQTEKVVPPERVRDVVQNSYPIQAALRRKQ